MAGTRPGPRPGRKPWLFLSHHMHVVLAVAGNADARAREIASTVGVTERSAQRILADLVAEGYLCRERLGRRNRYTVNREAHLRHPVLAHLDLGALVDAVESTRITPPA